MIAFVKPHSYAHAQASSSRSPAAGREAKKRKRATAEAKAWHHARTHRRRWSAMTSRELVRASTGAISELHLAGFIYSSRLIIYRASVYARAWKAIDLKGRLSRHALRSVRVARRESPERSLERGELRSLLETHLVQSTSAANGHARFFFSFSLLLPKGSRMCNSSDIHATVNPGRSVAKERRGVNNLVNFNRNKSTLFFWTTAEQRKIIMIIVCKLVSF